jgi:tetratricopeptide (TPR) repeat protein
MTKLSIGAVMLLLAVAGGAYVAGPYISAWWHLHRAAEALERDEFARAKAQAALSLSQSPRSVAAHLLAARAARRAGDIDEAKEHLSRCRELASDSPAVRLEQAMLDAQSGDLAAAEPVLSPELKNENADTVLILEALARGYRDRDQFNHAVACLNRWIRLRPGALQPLLWRGEIFERLADLDSASDDYHKAVGLAPDDTDARLHLGELLLHMQRFEDAIREFERLYDAQPGNVAVALGLAKCRRYQNRLDEATQLLQGVLFSFPHHVHALAQLGQLKVDADQAAAAEPLLREAFEATPFNREINYNLARCLSQQRKDADAKRYYDRVQQIDKDVERLTRLVREIAKKPHDAGLRYEAATIARANGDEDGAVRFLQGALREAPYHVPSHDVLAEVYERRGDAARAAAHRELARKFRAETHSSATGR